MVGADIAQSERDVVGGVRGQTEADREEPDLLAVLVAAGGRVERVAELNAVAGRIEGEGLIRGHVQDRQRRRRTREVDRRAAVDVGVHRVVEVDLVTQADRVEVADGLHGVVRIFVDLRLQAELDAIHRGDGVAGVEIAGAEVDAGRSESRVERGAGASRRGAETESRDRESGRSRVEEFLFQDVYPLFAQCSPNGSPQLRNLIKMRTLNCGEKPENVKELPQYPNIFMNISNRNARRPIRAPGVKYG